MKVIVIIRVRLKQRKTKKGGEVMNKVSKIMKCVEEIDTVSKLGGRKSFFGYKKIFEYELESEHKKIPKEVLKEDYPFNGFSGMECYGNIVHYEATKQAINNSIDNGFTTEEFKKIVKWYEQRGSIDTLVAAAFIKSIINI